MARDVEVGLARLVSIMARLRDPIAGCPWDLEQDFRSIAPYTIEEAYEVADAIDRRSLPDLCGELGDLLLQVVFHARMAEEAAAFTLDDVIEGICRKMVERHPHVFGNAEIADAAAQSAAWETHKANERAAQGDNSVMAGVSLALPALMRAQKLGKRAARAGFDWEEIGGVLAKLAEELHELNAAREAEAEDAIAEELGDVLFTCAQLSRHLSVNAEEALRCANTKFEQRIRWMEAQMHQDGQGWQGAPPDVLEAYWARAKLGN